MNITDATKNPWIKIQNRKNRVKPRSHSQRCLMVNNTIKHSIYKEDNSLDSICPKTFGNMHSET